MLSFYFIIIKIIFKFNGMPPAVRKWMKARERQEGGSRLVGKGTVKMGGMTVNYTIWTL